MLFFTSAIYLVFFVAISFFFCGRTRGPSFVEQAHVSSGDDKQMVAELPEYVKKAFVRKVYSILGIQIFCTVVIAASMMIFGGKELVGWMVTDGKGALYGSMFGSIIMMLFTFCYRHSVPLNMILLGGFTVLESLFVGFLCASYAADGLAVIVIEAFAITSIIFVGLTLFTMKSNINFDFLGPMLFVALLVLMVWSLFMTFFLSFESRQLFALVAVLIFSLYIVYDTHLVMNRLSPDEYIMGAIMLYIDFINVFIYLMQLLAGDRR